MKKRRSQLRKSATGTTSLMKKSMTIRLVFVILKMLKAHSSCSLGKSKSRSSIRGDFFQSKGFIKTPESFILEVKINFKASLTPVAQENILISQLFIFALKTKVGEKKRDERWNRGFIVLKIETPACSVFAGNNT